nr:expressed protein [Hymenolepis microstoma]
MDNGPFILLSRIFANAGHALILDLVLSVLIFTMSLIGGEIKPDTMQDVFSDKCHRINIENYDIYHFDEYTIEDRKYRYRLSNSMELMTIVCKLAGQDLLLVSVCTNGDHEARLREIHEYIKQRETANPPPDPKRVLGKGLLLAFKLVVFWKVVLDKALAAMFSIEPIRVGIRKEIVCVAYTNNSPGPSIAALSRI